MKTAADILEEAIRQVGAQILKSWYNSYDGGMEYRIFVPDRILEK